MQTRNKSAYLKAINGGEAITKQVQRSEAAPQRIVSMNASNDQVKPAFIKKTNVISSRASPVASSIATRKPSISPLFGLGSTKNISMHRFITSKGQANGLSASS